MVRYLPLAAIAVTIASAAAAVSIITGGARVIDGDSLMVRDAEVRLFGIDAPELSQTCTRAGQSWACGSAAADHLGRLIAGKQVTCSPVGIDQYGRTLARCSAGSTEINRAMVASGYALAFRRYSFDYISAEETAKAYKRGIWSGTFQLPSDVRRGADDHTYRPILEAPLRNNPVALSLRSSQQPTGECRIKGNQSRRGERIYHLPGMPYYDPTVAEQLFCSEAEARAAGFRRSRAR